MITLCPLDVATSNIASITSSRCSALSPAKSAFASVAAAIRAFDSAVFGTTFLTYAPCCAFVASADTPARRLPWLMDFLRLNSRGDSETFGFAAGAAGAAGSEGAAGESKSPGFDELHPIRGDGRSAATRRRLRNPRDFEVSRLARAAPALLRPDGGHATPTPRLLHYMFLSLVPPGAPPRPANLSRAYDYWMRSCVRANPAYKIVLWTRDDCDRLIATRHPKYAQFYNETLGAMGVIRQADFCRVVVLATHGGVYLDFDFLCVRSFDEASPDEIRSDSGGSSGDTGAAHREEELHEGDIRGSFAEGA